MVGVNALVEKEFSSKERPQQPRSAGADTRIPFSTKTTLSNALLAKVGIERPILRGGRLHGVQEKDVYTLTLLPHRKKKKMSTITVTTTMVTHVNAFSSTITPITAGLLPNDLVLALPHRSIPRWSASNPEKLEQVQALLDKSDIIKECGVGDTPIVEFKQEGDGKKQIVLYGGGVQLACCNLSAKSGDSDMNELLSAAELFAQAQDVLSFEGGRNEEVLTSDVEIEIGKVHNNGQGSLFSYHKK
jgi:hypothetical protein